MDGAGRIAIVGAGIAGLTAALSLSRAGADVTLFERAAELKALGAGIQLSPNALRVLDRLGLLHELSARSVAARSVVLRSSVTGRALAQVPVTARDGTGYLAVHRADLQDVLFQAVKASARIELAFDRELVSFEEVDDDVVITVRNDEGRTEQSRFALLVGADGVRSAVAARCGLPQARATGLVAARFTGRADPARPRDRIEAWLGPKRHAVAYPMSAGAAINLVLIAPEAESADELVAGFKRWDPHLLKLVEDASFNGIWPLAESERGRPLVPRHRICLIGDAAHAMLPFAAQGAAMAIEDAFVLGDAWARHPALSDGLAQFRKARTARIEAVRKRVAFHRLVYHLPRPFSLGRDLALALRSPASLARDLSWLYDWTP